MSGLEYYFFAEDPWDLELTATADGVSGHATLARGTPTSAVHHQPVDEDGVLGTYSLPADLPEGEQRSAVLVFPPGLEDWAGRPFGLVAGDPYRGQALWAFAHGMVVLEIDARFADATRLDTTWAEGAAAFAARLPAPAPGPAPAPAPA
jgi:hypothetical protein